ncbi:DUF3592 domain-containing protein [Nocardiopsis sp. NPDC057823]|uniref:DUF3592 domain-containing protein n=1 Tax=Nocardiopsis sp. NPDC057823 TaxID=3346256 RepID=UPI003670EF60
MTRSPNARRRSDGHSDGRTRWRALFRTCVVLPFLGLLTALVLSFGVGDAVTRLHYATGSATAPGTVQEIREGRPVVAFTTADGTEVTTEVRGDHRRGDPIDVTVRYLPERPTEAMLDGSSWIPPILFFLPAAPLLVLLVLRHPHGPRAALYRARLRGLAGAEPAERPPGLTPLLFSGALLTVGGAALVVVALAAFESWRSSDLFPALAVVGAALFPPGLDLLFRGRLLRLERGPSRPVPAPPRLWSTEAYAVMIGLAFLVVPLTLLVAWSVAEGEVDDPEEGTATVVAAGCGDVIGNGRGCEDGVALAYEVDGLPHTATADMLGLALEPGEEVRVVWDAEDPSLVLLEGPL